MDKSIQHKKRQERIQILKALYQMEFQNEKLPAQSSGIQETISNILNHKEQIDQVLGQHSQNWKLSRMALLDLSILRLAVYEIVFAAEKESSKIFINEAVEIAKIYGSADSPRFINGILDSVAEKERQK